MAGNSILPRILLLLLLFNTLLHIYIQREKSDFKSSEGKSQKNYKNDKVIITKKIIIKLKHKKKDTHKGKINATRLNRGSIRCKRKACKATQMRLSGVYGRAAPKESFNSVRCRLGKSIP